MLRRNRPRKPRKPKGGVLGGGGGGAGAQNPPAIPPAATFTITRDALDTALTFFNFDQPMTYAGTIPGWTTFTDPPRSIATITQSTPQFARVRWSGAVSVGQTVNCGNGSKSWRTQLGGAVVGGAHKIAAEG